ncbi:unnamed protein product [Ceratitis capitata]|uniref:(Mediterranean fruit fly) hypothetical protein n=1 Tax=Ceratitis capitata TaxID=7213 RepID=A0A811V2B5_CERCA|nr:unnamed protein product [Ceratitis capitata]
MSNKITIVSTFCFLLVLTIATLTAAQTEAEPKKCNEDCPTTRDLVCGYDSNCYARFDNKCLYDRLKCTTKHNLETVDMSLCDLAERKTHPAYRLC